MNAEPHLGHTYTTVVADTLARFWRARGRDAFFAHRHRRARRQDRAGRGRGRASTPQALRRPRERPLPRHLGRVRPHATTTSSAPPTPYHVRVRAGGPGARSTPRGDIYFGRYGGLYCYGCERFYQERELVDGQCPDHQRRADGDRGGELLLPHERSTRSALLATLEAQPELHHARRLPQRGARPAARAARRPLHLAAEDRASAGASSCPSTTATSPTSGSTRCSTT